MLLNSLLLLYEAVTTHKKKELRYNRIRHKLLHHLYLKYISNSDTYVNADKVGLTYSEIDYLLKDKKNKRELILSELYKNKEIEFFDLKAGKGCNIDEDHGISAYSNKKYLNENYKILKSFILFILPIVGMIIALTNLYLKFDSFKKTKNTEIKNLNYRIEFIENSIENKKNDEELKVNSLKTK